MDMLVVSQLHVVALDQHDVSVYAGKAGKIAGGLDLGQADAPVKVFVASMLRMAQHFARGAATIFPGLRGQAADVQQAKQSGRVGIAHGGMAPDGFLIVYTIAEYRQSATIALTGGPFFQGKSRA